MKKIIGFVLFLLTLVFFPELAFGEDVSSSKSADQEVQKQVDDVEGYYGTTPEILRWSNLADDIRLQIIGFRYTSTNKASMVFPVAITERDCEVLKTKENGPPDVVDTIKQGQKLLLIRKYHIRNGVGTCYSVIDPDTGNTLRNGDVVMREADLRRTGEAAWYRGPDNATLMVSTRKIEKTDSDLNPECEELTRKWNEKFQSDVNDSHDIDSLCVGTTAQLARYLYALDSKLPRLYRYVVGKIASVNYINDAGYFIEMGGGYVPGKTVQSLLIKK